MRAHMAAMVMAAAVSAQTAAADDGTRDPGTARGISIGVTTGGIAVIALAQGLHQTSGGMNAQNVLTGVGVLSVVVGPTTGHIYAGEVWNAGLGLRLGGAAALFGGVALALSTMDCHTCGGLEGGAAVLAFGGTTSLIGGTLVEVATAGDAARRHNERSGGVAIAPMIARDAHGLSLVAAF